MKVPARVYVWAAQYNPVSWYGVTCFSVSACLLVWWMFVYSSSRLMLVGYTASNASLRTQCSNTVSCVQSLRTTQQTVASLRDGLEAQHMGTSELHWISSVMQIAGETGLVVKSYQADADCVKDWYCCARARFEVVGTLDQIMKFLSSVHLKNRLLGCKQWSLVQSSDAKYTFSCLFAHLALSECCPSERKTPST